MLSGFADTPEYEARAPSWQPDDEFADIDNATAAARTWLDGQADDAQVEVFRLSGNEGTVKRVVMQMGIEEI